MHVIEPARYGGAETVVKALARGAARRGNPVHVVTLHQTDAPDPLAPALASEPLVITALRCGRRKYRTEASALAELLGAWRPDVLHTHVYHADVVGVLAARRTPVATVATVHGFTDGSLRNRLYQWIDMRALRRMDAVIGVSQTVVERVRGSGIPAERIHLVPNAYDGSVPRSRDDARRALGLRGDARVIGWVGRVSHEKGADRFVDMMARLGAGVPGVMGMIVGDGPERMVVEARARSLRAPVVFAGAHEDAGRLVGAFDALAITSRTEGLPMTALHAMAADVPVIATAVGALPGLLADDAGWIVTEATPESLAAAARAALMDTADARRRAMHARKRLEADYSTAAWLERIDRVYAAIT